LRGEANPIRRSLARLPVCIILASEWRKSRPCSKSFRNGFRTAGGTPLLPRCFPSSQSGFPNGSNTRHKCSPSAPWKRNESCTSRIYARPG
jgi:hypothetical protein